MFGAVTVPIHPQETGNWCWIANVQMVHAYFGHSITQCELANSRLGRTDCCTPAGDAPCPKTDNCNTPGNTRGAIESLGYTVTQANVPLTWDELRKEIYCRKKPLVFGDGAAGGGVRSEEHTSELQSLMRISYAVFCLKKKNNTN